MMVTGNFGLQLVGNGRTMVLRGRSTFWGVFSSRRPIVSATVQRPSRRHVGDESATSHPAVTNQSPTSGTNWKDRQRLVAYNYSVSQLALIQEC